MIGRSAIFPGALSDTPRLHPVVSSVGSRLQFTYGVLSDSQVVVLAPSSTQLVFQLKRPRPLATNYNLGMQLEKDVISFSILPNASSNADHCFSNADHLRRSLKSAAIDIRPGRNFMEDGTLRCMLTLSSSFQRQRGHPRCTPGRRCAAVQRAHSCLTGFEV